MRAALVEQLVTAALEPTAVLVELVELVTPLLTVVSEPMAVMVALVAMPARALAVMAVMAVMVVLALPTGSTVALAASVVMAEPMAPPVVSVP